MSGAPDEDKDPEVWEGMQGPIGPVPDPRPLTMLITVWSRKPRPSEANKAADKAAAAEEKRKAADLDAVFS